MFGIPAFLLDLGVFIGVLSVLVLVHELGHFLAARAFGIRVDEFAFGLPFTKAIFKYKYGETQYSIYPLLFGGFVRLHGEESEAKDDAKRSFFGRRKLQRAAVIVAGVVMNMVLALVLFVGLYGTLGVPSKPVNLVTLVDIEAEAPASVSGLKIGDRIISVEGKTIGTTDEFSRLMKSWAGVAVNVQVERGETEALFEGLLQKNVETVEVSVVPRLNPPEGKGPLGVAIASYPYLQVKRCLMFNVECLVDTTGAGVRATGVWLGRVVDGFSQIGKSLSAGKAPEGVAGPVGIFKLTGIVAHEGILPLIELVAVLSVNLAVFNILPIPALDGGRLLFIVIEWVRGKRVSTDLEQKINSWGMMLLLGLVALITLGDVIRGLV